MRYTKRRKPRPQVTCECRAYKFPHRLSGGRCSGSEWAESYLHTVGTMCRQCNCFRPETGSCDVANGAESISYCEGYIDFLHYDSPLRLPRTLEDMMPTLPEEDEAT